MRIRRAGVLVLVLLALAACAAPAAGPPPATAINADFAAAADVVLVTDVLVRSPVA